MNEFMIGVGVGAIIVFLMAVTMTTPDNLWKSQAASRGYGEYCIPNGEFAWKGECE